jgi:hypothetical protein
MMSRYAALLAACLTGGFGLGSDGDATHQGRFPQLKASNLEKKEFTLPGGLEGKRNLLLVAFQRKQQEQVDTWLREMKRFEELDADFYYYELPTIQSPNRLVRWFIDNGMRRGIPDRKARARTITLYIDKRPFLQALGIIDENRIHCFLVDRAGSVLWRTDGSFDEAKATSLREFLLSQVGPGSTTAVGDKP